MLAIAVLFRKSTRRSRNKHAFESLGKLARLWVCRLKVKRIAIDAQQIRDVRCVDTGTVDGEENEGFILTPFELSKEGQIGPCTMTYHELF